MTRPAPGGTTHVVELGVFSIPYSSALRPSPWRVAAAGVLSYETSVTGDCAVTLK
jgi:hypothetical protein